MAMKMRIVILIVVLALLLGGSAAMARSSEQGSPALRAAQQDMMSGEGYHLTRLTWQVSGAASGTGYSLVSPGGPTGTGTQCCCSYLPCVLRSP
jgi:hypothetical protein